MKSSAGLDGEMRATGETVGTTKQDADELRVALLGTGIMGSAMARNLVRAGFSTTVWDRSPSATGELATLGARVATSPEDAIRDAKVVITMLPTAAERIESRGR